MRERDRRFLHRHPITVAAGNRDGIRPEGLGAGAQVLNHVRAAAIDVVHQARVVFPQVRAHVVRAHTRDNRIEPREIALPQVVLLQQRDLEAQAGAAPRALRRPRP